MMRVTTLVASSCLLAALAWAQSPPSRAVPPRDNSAAPSTGTAVVRGLVVAADTGAPLRRASIRVSGGGPIRRAMTDAQGRYELRDVPAGRLTLIASKAGYLTLSHNQRRPFEPARPVDIAAGQVLENVNFGLPRGGVIDVRVTDEAGAPITGVEVAAERFAFSTSGERRLAPAGITAPYAVTDDRGEYRISGLPPGDYFVSARPTRGPGRASAPAIEVTYFPGASSVADAQRVRVELGSEIQVTLPVAPVALARVSGTIQMADGRAPDRHSVHLGRYHENGFGSSSIRLSPDGRFEITSVAPGQYFVEVRPNNGVSGEESEYAAVPVTVAGRDVTGLVVTTRKAAGLITGRVSLEGGSSGPLAPGSFQLAAAGPQRPNMSDGVFRWRDGWNFEIGQLTGARLIRVGVLPRGWYLKAVMLDGKDVTDIPLETETGGVRGLDVILTQRPTELSGVVVDARANMVTDYAVVVFPPERERWNGQTRYIAVGRPDQTGKFTILGLPTGRYLAAAVEYLESGEERDAALLDRLLASAIPVAISDTQPVSIKLTLLLP